MQIEETQRLPAPRHRVYDYIMDPATWTHWQANLITISPDQARWEQPGDQIGLAYQLLGTGIELKAELNEIQPGQYVRSRVTSPALGWVTCEWFFADAGETSTTVRIVCETDDSTSVEATRRDIRDALRNLARVLA